MRGGGLRWGRAIAFDDLDDLVSEVEALLPVDAQQSGAVENIANLGILCHGRPGGLRLLASRQILTENGLSSHGAQLRRLADALTSWQRLSTPPVVTILACAAAAERQGLAFFELLSAWMPGVSVVAFTRLLVSAAVTPRVLGDGSICLPPDVAITEERYDDSLDIAAQGIDDDIDESTLAGAGPSASRAVFFVNGRRVDPPRMSSIPTSHRRPTRAGRANGTSDTPRSSGNSDSPMGVHGVSERLSCLPIPSICNCQ